VGKVKEALRDLRITIWDLRFAHYLEVLTVTTTLNFRFGNEESRLTFPAGTNRKSQIV